MANRDDSTLRAELVRAIAIARTVAMLRSAKVGVIGTHAPGFIDLAADPFLIQRNPGHADASSEPAAIC